MLPGAEVAAATPEDRAGVVERYLADAIALDGFMAARRDALVVVAAGNRGADDDPNIEVALSYLETGACPPEPAPAMQFKLQSEQPVPMLELRGTPAREFAGAL